MKAEINVYEVKELEDMLCVFDAFKDCKTLTFMKDEETKVSYAKKLLENGHTIVEKRNGESVGFICFYSNDKVTKTGYITAFALDENLGIGKGKTLFRLFREGVKIASQAGMTSVKLEVAESNTKARKLYEAFGFKYLPEEGDGTLYMAMDFDDLVGKMLKK